MQTILIVDDESSVVEALSTSIDWKNLGVDCILTASNGKEGLEQAKQHHISLVIADIRMPIMDGLTFLRLLRECSPDTHMILLTAYSEFAYAKEAIALGVENYLLKPLIIDEVETTVKQAMDNIYAHKSGQFLAYSNIIFRWITGAISRDELADRSVQLSLNPYLPSYAVAYIEHRRNASISGLYIHCVEALSNVYTVYSCRNEQDDGLLLIGGINLTTDTILEKIKACVQEKGLENSVGISVGNLVDDAMDVSQSYRNARASLAAAPFASLIRTAPKEIKVALEEILFLFLENKEDTATDSINSYVKKQPYSKVPDELFRYMQACMQIIKTEFPAATEQYQQLLYDEQEDFARTTLAQGLHASLAVLLNRSYKFFRTQFRMLNPTVQLALMYIQNKYSSGISIRAFCASRAINPAYLGHMFKKECGIYFNEYLARIRISHAILLLQESDLLIAEIAIKTGFSSVSYFIKCFRAETSMSPTEFRIEHYHLTLLDKG